MQNLKLDIVSDEEVKMIHETSLDILEKIGVKISHPKAVEIFKKNGCTYDEATHTVKMPRTLIEEVLQTMPHSFTMYSRDGKHDVKMTSDGSRTNFMNLGMGTKICHCRGKDQYETLDATVKDIGNIAKLEDALENVDLLTQPVSAIDLMQVKCARTLYETEAMVLNTSKPFLLDPRGDYVPDYFNMMKACYGGDDEEARKKPFMLGGSCTSSPLQYDDEFFNILINQVEYDIPFMSMTMAMAGATSPISLAGTIAVHNAEALGGLALTQLIKPGHPCFYGSCTTNFDFMSNTAPFGSPENALICSTNAKLSQFYGIPLIGSGAICDAKTPGFQSAMEATMNSMAPLLAGCSNVFGVGLIELGMSYSMEQAVMINDMIPLLRKLKDGVEVTKESLAFEGIKEAGIGGSYISSMESMNGMFSVSHPEIMNRDMYDTWKSNGCVTDIEAAHAKVVDIMENHVPTPVGADAEKEIKNIIKAADKKL